jgi:glutathione peroxidase
MKSKNGVSDSTVKWNFQKYLINENGTIDKVLSPSTKPMSAEILEWIRH